MSSRKNSLIPVPYEETAAGRIEAGRWDLNDLNHHVSLKRMFDAMDRASRMADSIWMWTST